MPVKSGKDDPPEQAASANTIMTKHTLVENRIIIYLGLGDNCRLLRGGSMHNSWKKEETRHASPG